MSQKLPYLVTLVRRAERLPGVALPEDKKLREMLGPDLYRLVPILFKGAVPKTQGLRNQADAVRILALGKL